jgi:glycosyltransferase involved in cell wall biosynthesis
MRVSICIPTYNQAKYLQLAITSAINQTYKPYEIIVSDDCSTDDTATLLTQLSLKVPNLKFIRQPVNLGIAENVNRCLRMAEGDYIIRLDSDDELLPNYTKDLLELFHQYPEAGYAHGAVQEIDQNGNFLSQRKLYRKTGFQDWIEALKKSIHGYRVAANIVMFKRQALEKVDYLNGRPNYVEDYHTTTSISAAGFGNLYIDKIISHYRVWTDGAIRPKRKILEITGLRSVFEQVIEPAFAKQGWDMNILKAKRSDFASAHSDCLRWKVFNDEERASLKRELLLLSSSTKANLSIWANTNGLGGVFAMYRNMNLYLKKGVKELIGKIKR